MENTLENKAKFFALYCGQRIVYFINEPSNTLLVSGALLGGKDYFYLEKSCLQLTTISQITDEDFSTLNYTKDYLEMLKNDMVESIDSIVVDVLRSKGYALPWMGLSVEQLVSFGWVKLKEG